MAVLSDDMGGITAYAAAVNRGYTGTKEEFEQLMYSYTEVAERAEAAAGNAHESEEATIEAKDIAVSAKNEAVSARDAAVSARDSSISAKNDSESARDSAISAKNDTLAAKDAVMSAKSDVDETSANFSEEVTAAISDVNAAGRNQKELAKTHAIDSEAWAVGQREGADVGVSDETYHNNSKYYAEQSALAKSETETARDTAITAKNDAVSAKNEAETAKGQAQDIVDGINAKSEQIDQNAEDITALQTAMETKAEIDGYYEGMTVGDAEQLVSSKYVEDSEPYLYRTSGGSKDIGNREYVDAIVGGTINWNQLVQNGNFESKSGWNWGSGTVSNNTISATHTSTGAFSSTLSRPMQCLIGHVYFIATDHMCTVANQIRARHPFVGRVQTVIANVWARYSWIDKINSNGTQVGIQTNSVENETSSYRNYVCFDLTAMFGSTIADYIYSLEQANAGDGVAWFRKYFPKNYYEYNSGELISVSGLTAHKMTGFNQWDEEWEVGDISASDGTNAVSTVIIRSKNYIPLVSDAVYYFKAGDWGADNNVRTRFYDTDKNYIGYVQEGGSPVIKNSTFTPPKNARYMRFTSNVNYGATYKNDICINLHWDGERDGEYEPYEEHSYPLDSNVELRGPFKLDSNNDLYADGDIYNADGTINRQYNIITFDGTQTVENSSFDGAEVNAIVRYSLPVVAKVGSSSDDSTALISICDKLMATSRYMASGFAQWGASTTQQNTYSINVEGLKIAFGFKNSALTDRSKVSSYLAEHPITVIYEVATPTTEQAQPFTNPQIVDDFGTEEYVTDSIVPVGHETRYPANLRDKLQHLPDLADDDGYYMISQQNKNMSLELFRIPKAPTTDGVYTLKATVSGGTPTYTWEAEE